MNKLSFLLITVIIFISSCDECVNVDCISSNYIGQFRIIRTSDSADLVFGDSSIYDQHRIRFYTLNGNDTNFLDYRPSFFPGGGYDSIVLVNFFPRKDVAYMRLSNGDIDTFQLTYENIPGTKCCDEAERITSFRFNGISIPGGQGTQLIRK